MDTVTVGFDLDMTLVDSRPGIAATCRQLSAQTGVPIDADLVVTRLGPPLAHEMANWFPADRVAEAVERYRALSRDHAIGPTLPLPGAREAVDAVRAAGGRVVVVTAKLASLARLHLDHLGLAVDEVTGDVWAEGKTAALRAHGVDVYVGDHVADMTAARGVAVAVGVTTGPCTAEELVAAGADVVLPDLTGFPDWLSRHLLTNRLAGLDRRLRALDRVVVAFSGGADSAFLLAAAVRALGPDRVTAATAVSPSLPARELAAAREFASALGVRHLRVETAELDRPGYRANGGDRCYFCKAELIEALAPVAAGAAILTGTNADDAVAGFRPGMRAAAERGALTPLRDAGLTKAQVRAASRDWGLSTWDKPAAACLSSRVAYGVEITAPRLARVDRAEVRLRAALAAAAIPVRDLRVRDLGDTARVEVDAAAVGEVCARPDLLAAVRSAGFARVEVDPRGFRSGAMNELLAEPDRYR
jgi:uncharacterized protein